MKNNLTVSVIIPTKNSSKTIGKTLESIKAQTFKDFEIIIVDNSSIDNTKSISLKYTDKIYNKGPERSTQRNFGAKKSAGKYLLFLDSDMALDKKAIKEAVDIFENNLKIGALIIPEKSIGKGFWGKCKMLEKSFCEGVPWLEAARIYRRNVFEEVKGFDTKLISGEDWDLSNRVKKKTGLSRIDSYVTHNEGDVSLISTVKKKYYYSRHISKYISKSNGNPNIMVAERYKLYLTKPRKLFENPAVGIGLLFIKTCEFGGGFLGYMVGKIYK